MNLWPRIYAERRRVLLPLLIAAVVNAAILLLVVIPLGRSVNAAETDAGNATLALATARQAERQARNVAASRERADRELQRFYADVLPDGFAVAARATNRWLQQAAREAGVTYLGSNFSWEDLRGTSLSRAYSTVSLRGRYQDIRQFLHAVETATEFLVVERVDLAQPSAPTSSGTLDVAVIVSTFFVTEPPPQ